MLPQPPQGPQSFRLNAGGFGLHKKHKRLPVSCIKLESLCRAIIYIFCAIAYPLKTFRGQMRQKFFETLYQQGLQRVFFACVLLQTKNPEYLCGITTKKDKSCTVSRNKKCVL